MMRLCITPTAFYIYDPVNDLNLNNIREHRTTRRYTRAYEFADDVYNNNDN